MSFVSPFWQLFKLFHRDQASQQRFSGGVYLFVLCEAIFFNVRMQRTRQIRPSQRLTRSGEGVAVRRPATRTAQRREAPATATQTETNASAPVLQLRLRRRRRVHWTEDTRDNENDGKKSSKSCCIFHRKRAWDESSTESESGDDGHDGHSDGSSSSGGPVQRLPERRIPQDDWGVDLEDKNERDSKRDLDDILPDDE